MGVDVVSPASRIATAARSSAFARVVRLSFAPAKLWRRLTNGKLLFGCLLQFFHFLFNAFRLLAELFEFSLERFELVVRQLFQIDQLVPGRAESPNELVEFQMHRFG